MCAAVAPHTTRNGGRCVERIELNTKRFESGHLDVDLIMEAARVAFRVFGVGSSVPHAMPEALLGSPLRDAARPLSYFYLSLTRDRM
jgi:hypothetical protein